MHYFALSPCFYKLFGILIFFFCNHLKETAYFLLVYRLTYIKAFYLVFIPFFADFYFYLYITGVFISKPQYIECSCLFKRSRHQICLVCVLYYMWDARYYTPVYARPARVGIEIPPDYGAFQCRLSGFVTRYLVNWLCKSSPANH